MQERQKRAQTAVPPKLFEILGRQIQFAKELLGVLEEEMTALTAMDVQQLFNITKKKLNQVKRLQYLDDALQEMLIQIAPAKDNERPTGPRRGRGVNSFSAKGIKLSAVIPFFHKEDGAKLLKQRDELFRLQEEIQSRNRLNKRFTGDILGYVGDAISLITNGIAEAAGYGARGAVKSAAAARPTFISREV